MTLLHIDCVIKEVVAKSDEVLPAENRIPVIPYGVEAQHLPVIREEPVLDLLDVHHFRLDAALLGHLIIPALLALAVLPHLVGVQGRLQRRAQHDALLFVPIARVLVAVYQVQQLAAHHHLAANLEVLPRVHALFVRLLEALPPQQAALVEAAVLLPGLHDRKGVVNQVVSQDAVVDNDAVGPGEQRHVVLHPATEPEHHLVDEDKGRQLGRLVEVAHHGAARGHDAGAQHVVGKGVRGGPGAHAAPVGPARAQHLAAGAHLPRLRHGPRPVHLEAVAHLERVHARDGEHTSELQSP